MVTPTKALGESEICGALTGELSHWTFQDHAIQRIHTCHAYLDSLDLVCKIGHMAEAAHHHPDMMLHYKRVTIRYWTHTAKGVTTLDIQCAREAEALIRQKSS